MLFSPSFFSKTSQFLITSTTRLPSGYEDWGDNKFSVDIGLKWVWEVIGELCLKVYIGQRYRGVLGSGGPLRRQDNEVNRTDGRSERGIDDWTRGESR